MKNNILNIQFFFKKLKGKFSNSPLRKAKNGNFIFIHINKTGGTSIGKAIGLPFNRHLNVKEVISLVGEKKFSEAFVFSVVRNPWSKVVSHYNYRVKTNQANMANNHISFKDWVACTYGIHKDKFYYDNPKMFDSQSNWLKDKDGMLRVTNILRIETLSKDFKVIADRLEIEDELPHLNKTRVDSYRTYYDEETKIIVEKSFKEDIERFKYSF